MAIPLTTIKLRREQVFGVVVCVCPLLYTRRGGRCSGGEGSDMDSDTQEGKGARPQQGHLYPLQFSRNLKFDPVLGTKDSG